MEENLNEKSKIIETAAEKFYRFVGFAEKRVWSLLQRTIDRLDRTGGVLDNSQRNQSLLLSITELLLNAIYGTPTDDGDPSLTFGSVEYLEDFDQVERLNRLIYQGFLTEAESTRVARMIFSTERTFIVDQVTRQITERAYMRANVAQPIQDILYRGIVFRQPLREVENRLRDEILTNEDGSSRLLRYTRQVTQDAISQFDGAINDRIRDDLGLDGMYYVGSIIKTTRQNCYDLIRGANKYSDLAIEPGFYRVADLPEIVARSQRCEIHHTTGKKDCGSGWNPSCDANTFGRFRGGYGCRHEVIYAPIINGKPPQDLRTAIK